MSQETTDQALDVESIQNKIEDMVSETVNSRMEEVRQQQKLNEVRSVNQPQAPTKPEKPARRDDETGEEYASRAVEYAEALNKYRDDLDAFNQAKMEKERQDKLYDDNRKKVEKFWKDNPEAKAHKEDLKKLILTDDGKSIKMTLEEAWEIIELRKLKTEREKSSRFKSPIKASETPSPGKVSKKYANDDEAVAAAVGEAFEEFGDIDALPMI